MPICVATVAESLAGDPLLGILRSRLPLDVWRRATRALDLIQIAVGIVVAPERHPRSARAADRVAYFRCRRQSAEAVVSVGMDVVGVERDRRAAGPRQIVVRVHAPVVLRIR